MRCNGSVGGGSHWIHCDCASCCVEGVCSKQILQSTCQLRLTFRTQAGKVVVEFDFCPLIQNEHGFAMEIIGRPVRSHIAAVSPDGANLHTTERLPDILTLLNVARTNHFFAGSCDHPIRNWRQFVVDSRPHPSEYKKRNKHYQSKRNPETSH